VSCIGYAQPQIRTGYEQVLPHRTSDLFAMTAKKPGKVISVSEHGIIVQYDGDEKPTGYELGRRFGNAAGLVIPHSVKTDMIPGQVFKTSELICYNTGFFEKDLFNPNDVVWKSGIMVKTALMESNATLDDSSAISRRAAKLLSTSTTKVKYIVVNFDQSIRRLVKPGDKVESESILCVIEDAITAESGLFDEESLDTLRILSAQTPQAKTIGKIERIEVFYNGMIEDMSDSLRSIVTTYDREFSKRNRAAGKTAYTGSVDEGFRIEGDPLSLDTLAIKVYITGEVPAGVGD